MITQSTSDKTNSEAQYPYLLNRVQALFVDFILILLIFLASSLILPVATSNSTGLKIAIFMACVVLYEPLLVAFNGGTLGHKLMNISVRSYADPEKNISVASAFLRIIIKGFLGWISFLTVSFNDEKRALHDMASGAIVLRKQ